MDPRDYKDLPGSYSDIMDHPHYQSKTRSHMSMLQRAAQFAPFAALSGYDDAIAETMRVTEERIVLSEDRIDTLNEQLSDLYERIREHPAADITFFRKDPFKEGGSYETVSGKLKKIDRISRCIIMENDTVIQIEDIIEIERH